MAVAQSVGKAVQKSSALTGLNPGFGSALQQLLEAAGGRVWIVSGYRSPERQAQLFSAAVKKYGSEQAARKWVAPPGKSNHNKGFAADLGGDLDLAHRLAPKFGLYFPMAHEKWHVEPMGHRGDKDAYTPAPGSDAPAEPADPREQVLNAIFGPPIDDLVYHPSGASAVFGDLPYKGGAKYEQMGGSARDWVIQHESGGRATAKNPKSTAFGKGQLLRANRIAAAKALGIANPDTTDPDEQDRMADWYVEGRYGSWERAKEFWQEKGYY